jgi:hypothetical protein
VKATITGAGQALADDEREVTLGADNGCDAEEFLDACMAMPVTPPVAQNKAGRPSALPDELAQTEGYAISQRKRKLFEHGYRWAQAVGCVRQVMVRGLKRVDQISVLTMVAHKLVLMRTLGEVRPQGG